MDLMTPREFRDYTTKNSNRDFIVTDARGTIDTEDMCLFGPIKKVIYETWILGLRYDGRLQTECFRCILVIGASYHLSD